jgi:hypothetical protein
MELFARISLTLPLGSESIENDIYISEELNNKLKLFIHSHGITEYRILNAESFLIPEPAVGPGYEVYQSSVFISYKAL